MDATIRSALEPDTDAIAELIADRIGDEDAKEAEMVLEDPSFRSRWFVAESEGRILSTAAVFPGQLSIGPVAVGAGAIEFVATHPDAEGSGLVRSLMDEIHRTAPTRGEMVQWIVGITYFYRKFGYEYAIPVEAMYNFPQDASPEMPTGWETDEVSGYDLANVFRAQLEFAKRADISLTATERMWDFYSESPVYRIIRASGPDGPAYGRVYAYETDRYLFDIVAESSNAVAALINAAGDGGQYEVSVLGRPALRHNLDELATPQDSGDAYYVRVAEPMALLEAMRPVLAQRLDGLDEGGGEALLSMYQSSIRFKYGVGRVGPMGRAKPEPAPIGAGGSGVAPDKIVSLLLGPLGAARLAELNPDVNLGEQEALMEALFPPQTCDVHSWVVP